MSGCAICVYDLYDEARQDYVKAMDHLRSQLTKIGVPETEWPADVRSDGQSEQTTPATRTDVVLSAFEQLELALTAKQEKQVQPSPPNAAAQRSEG